MEIVKYRLKNLVPKQPWEFLEWYTIGKAKQQIDKPFFWSPEFLGVDFLTAVRWHKITLLLGMVGCIIYYLHKRRNQLGTLLIATIIYFIVVYLPFFTMGRYFYPAMPLVVIFTAYAIVKFGALIFYPMSFEDEYSQWTPYED
jgi:tryptophan-rich sensory protein